MDAHGSLWDKNVRQPPLSKLGFAKMSRIQFSVLCVGPRCVDWEEQRTKYNFLLKGLNLALWEVAAHDCCSGKWARCENNEESRLRLSSLTLLLVVVMQQGRRVTKTLMRAEGLKAVLTVKEEICHSGPASEKIVTGGRQSILSRMRRKFGRTEVATCTASFSRGSSRGSVSENSNAT